MVTGVQTCVFRSIATQTAKDFLAFLKHSFCLDTLFVGYDHTFGSDRIRDFDKIEAICNAMGIKAHKSEQFDLTGQTVSSSRIREYLHNGKILEANAMLGYKYSLKGIVMHGQMIGRTLGFPTANLKNISDKLLPHNEVYAVEVIIDGIRHKGMLNIGNRPTVDGINHTVEVNIFDFDRDIYGKEIEVLFCRFVRDEVKFGSLERLKTQLGLAHMIRSRLMKIIQRAVMRARGARPLADSWRRSPAWKVIQQAHGCALLLGPPACGWTTCVPLDHLVHEIR